MENGFSFMTDYLQMASFVLHEETINQQESMTFCQFARVAGCG